MNKLLSRKSLVLLAVIVLSIINAFSGLLTERLGDDIEGLLKKAGIDEYRLHITAGLIIAGLLATGHGV